VFFLLKKRPTCSINYPRYESQSGRLSSHTSVAKMPFFGTPMKFHGRHSIVYILDVDLSPNFGSDF